MSEERIEPKERDRDASSGADARMTADRDEIKYLLEGADARVVAGRLDGHLPRHQFRRSGADPLPNVHNYVTTIYFDTESRDVAQACQAGDTSLKLRAKEYYGLHPSLAELATTPQQMVAYDRVLWLETKRRFGRRTMKNRFGIPKQDLPAFFVSGIVTAEMIQIQAQEYGEAVDDVLADLRELCRPYAGPLRADCLINYRRRAWQDDAGALRITIDSNLAIYAPPNDLWQREQALTRENLGPPTFQMRPCVLEVKSRGVCPDWLNRVFDELRLVPALESDGSTVAFSKFVAASEAVHP